MAGLFIFIIMCMRIIQNIYNKKTSLLLTEGVPAFVRYLVMSFWMSTAFSLIAMILAGELFGFNTQLLVIAACSGGFLALSTIASLKALMGGTVVLGSIFSTAGLIVPCVLGIFVFDEAISWVQAICILAVLLSTVLLVGSSKDAKGTFSVKTLFWLMMSFLSNGMVMFCQKLFGELQPQGSVSMFSMFTFLVPAIMTTCMLPFMKKTAVQPTEKARAPKWKLPLYAAFLAFAVFVIQQLVTYLTPMMPAALLFTVVGGSSTVIAAIIGALMYKEKLTAKSICGVVLGIGAMIVMKMV